MLLNEIVRNETYDAIFFLSSSFLVFGLALLITNLFIKYVMKVEGL